MFVVYVSYAFIKWNTIVECNFSISIITWCRYVSCYKNICVWIITEIWFNDLGFKFNGCAIFISITIVCFIWSLITYHFLVANFKDSLHSSPSKFAIFFLFPLLYVIAFPLLYVTKKLKQLLHHLVKIQNLFLSIFQW